MDSTDQQERRKYPRIGSDQLVSFAPFAKSARLGEARDVSLGGMRFAVVGDKVVFGELLSVSFNVGEQTVEAVGRVVWTRPLDPVTVEVGLEFVRIDPWAARLLGEERERQGKEADGKSASAQ